MKTVLVIGASSGIGRATVEEALERGLTVKAFSRSATKMTLSHERLVKVDGDALSRSDVDGALEKADAVVQSLGIPLNRKTIVHGTSLFSEATAVLLPAMAKAEARRLVCVTGFGAGDSEEAIPLWQRPGFEALFGRIYRDKGIQERMIKESNLDWTIARPTILTDKRKTGKYKALTDPAEFKTGRISRADVADFIVTALAKKTYIGEAPVLTR